MEGFVPTLLRRSLPILIIVLCAAPLTLFAQANEAFREHGLSPAMREAIDALPKDPVYTLPIPVVGVSPSDITDTWGNARSAGRVHEGTDIMAPRDTEVVSPTDAVVASIGWGALGGNYVFTVNPGDERYYFAHLDKIAPGLARGDVLKAGDLIGYVGNTGDASGGPTHLHFGIYTKNGAVNPYPRLTGEFSQAKQEVIVASAKLASQSVTKDMTLGSKGASVVWLQGFLIAKHAGPEASVLSKAGATGYFGPITKKALAEYQASNGIHPATGYFGPITRRYLDTAIKEVQNINLAVFTRDLTTGNRGEDVRALQVFLNSDGFLVAKAGPGSVGNETTYFGPATKRALERFQASNGIHPASGYFGPITRSHLKGLQTG